MPSLAEVLIDKGIFTKEQLTETLKAFRGSGKSFEEILVESGLMDDRKLVELILAVTPYRYVDLKNLEIDRSAIKLIPVDIAERFLVFPIAKSGDYLSLAMANPIGKEAYDVVTRLSNLKIIPFVASISDIKWAVERYYRGKGELEREVEPVLEGLIVHEGNKFAVSVARDVLNQKKKGIIIFYGPEGVGKTSLLRSIYGALERADIKGRFYNPTTFKASYNDSKVEGTLRAFLSELGIIDILLFDDIDGLYGEKEVCQSVGYVVEELVDSGKSVFLTLSGGLESIQMAGNIKLRNLMEGGLLVPITPPDRNVMLKILVKISKEENVNISDEVLKFIVDKAGSNLRRLKGAIVQLKSLEEYAGKRIPDEVAKSIVRRYLT